jgi:hypothetical protein
MNIVATGWIAFGPSRPGLRFEYSDLILNPEKRDAKTAADIYKLRQRRCYEGKRDI